MTDPALTTIPAPTVDLEPPAIGDALYSERTRRDLDDARLFWEGSYRVPAALVGTTVPGDVHLDLTAFDDGPWWDEDLLRVDDGYATPDVDDIMRGICAGLDVWYPPWVPQLEDLNPYARPEEIR